MEIYFFVRQFFSRVKYTVLGKLPFTDTYKQLRQIRNLKGKYVGKRCFFVGSGPSLRISDLELLNGEVTFALNRIFKIFDDTNWRPTFYLNQEINFKEGIKFVNEINNVNFDSRTTLLFPFTRLKKKIMAENSLFLPIYMDLCELHQNPVQNFSTDCSVKIVHAYTSMYTILQIAVYLGFSKIYLIGVDGQYFPGKSHFYEDPSDESNFYNSDITQALTNNLERGFKGMKLAEDQIGSFEIINLTRGGKLELFPRCNIDDVLFQNP